MRKRISDFGFRISGELAAASTHARRGMPEILVRLLELATARKNGFRISDFGCRMSGELAAASAHASHETPKIVIRLPEFATAPKSPDIRNPKSEILFS